VDGSRDNWLTLGQAAKVLGVAQSTVRAWSDAGRLPVFYTPGGHRRFKQDDLDAFLSRNGAGSRPRNAATVLVVDDDARLRELIRVNLEYDGMTVIEAASAEEGLRAIDTEAPDLVMLDVMMPGIDGWGVAEQLAEDDEMREIPVVFLSARAAQEDRLHAQELGAVGYVVKPFDPLELAGKVREVLHRVAMGEREELNRELSESE
jgi:excisionase family DNA binding protein